MKTITRNSDDISIYYFPDDKTITLQADQIVIGDLESPELYISDCNSSNVTIHTGVDAKSDWWGHKYKHDGSSWSDNSDFKGEHNLASDINDSVTTIPVVDSNPFTTSGTIQIEDEKIAYTGVDGTNLTGATRGASSTSATNHITETEIRQI